MVCVPFKVKTATISWHCFGVMFFQNGTYNIKVRHLTFDFDGSSSFSPLKSPGKTQVLD
jgi:hypothetical protein